MATPKIVPRLDGEGQIGTTDLRWGEGHFDTVGIGGESLKDLHIQKTSGEAGIRLQSGGSYWSDIHQSASNLFIQNTSVGGNIIFYDDSAERMRIDTDGNVGIGNAAPGSNLEISKVSGQPALELSAWSATATAAHAGVLKFQKSGTAAVNTFTAGDHTTAGEILGRIEAYGVDDADGATLSSYIEFANDAVSDADSSPGKILFATSDADDAGTPTVALTLDDGQNATFAGNISSATYKTMWVGAGEMIPNETDGAQAVTEETATRNVMIDAMAFDKDADEHVYFTKVMPRQWNGGTVKFKFYWKPTSTDTGTAQFSISANSYVSDDSIDVSFSGDVTNTALAASGTATDLMITAATGALTIGGSPTQDEECLIFFRLFRDVSGDTFNGDVHLIGVLIQYQEGTGIVAAW